MRRMATRHLLRNGIAVGILASLGACGGGGGGGGVRTPAPAPVPTPSPTPTPTPTPTATPTPAASFNTPEFRRSDGPDFHNAVSAWSDGINGDGVTLAIIDSGIDEDNPEFAGRISPDSIDVAGNDSFDAEDDHGTNVALVAAAARNNTGVVGIAFGATILAIRADEPGSCASEDPDDEDSGCSFFDTDIAEGIDHAVASGAVVINLSLGGGRTSFRVINAVRRAAAAGVIVVVSAGNDGDHMDDGNDPDNPDLFAQDIQGAGGSHAIIVGSVDDQGTISDFSNKAGTFQNAYITARGERICCVYEDGELFVNDEGFAFVFSGTSFAAPQVTGAIALLKQAFPNLSGDEIVSILLDSARDAGTAGNDAIYGAGILDIAAAFAPQGATSLAGGTQAVKLGESGGSTSPAMGDAGSQGGLSSVITDKYDRAYGIDLASRLGAAPIAQRLAPAVGQQTRFVSLGNQTTSLAFTIDQRAQNNRTNWAQQLRLSHEDAEAARVLAARVAMKLDADTEVALAFAESTDGIVAQLQGQDRPAFKIARTALSDEGLYRSNDGSLAVRRQLGDFGVTLSAGSGSVRLDQETRFAEQIGLEPERYGVTTYGLGLDRKFGTVEAALGLTWMKEEDTILGARFVDALGTRGSDTMFVDASAGWNIDSNWRLGAAVRNGFTRAHAVGQVAGGSTFRTLGWSADIERRGLFSRFDRLGLRISQPLRVEQGGLNFNLPVAYDYATESATFGLRQFSLSPTGRELTGEMAWRGPLWGGDASASLFYRTNPGHFSTLPDDQGVAIRWNRRF